MKAFFAAEPIRRYLLWAGATPDQAFFACTDPETSTFDFMPINKATGKPYTVDAFVEDMAAFADMLPEGGKGFHFEDKNIDPYFTTDTVDDQVGIASKVSDGEPLFVGLTGERGVGKSYLTAELENIGFKRVHPFNPGKALLRGYYVSRGATEEEAFSMTDGDLKDKPAPRDVLPVDPKTGKNYTSRSVMEPLGWFMANTIGLSSTIGVEMAHWASAGEDKILIDSVVYEADEIRKNPNAIIMDIQVPAHLKKDTGIISEHTSARVSTIKTDATIINEMNGIAPLMDSFYAGLESNGIHIRPEPETSLHP